jgi:hypothetical protein
MSSAVRAERTFAAANGIGMSLGAGSSSYIQPDVARLDVGP